MYLRKEYFTFMIQISADTIQEITEFKSLIDALHDGFTSKIETPMRHHHDYANPEVGVDSTLLLMPSWEAGKNLGVKIVTVSPENGRLDLPSIQGTYLLFNAIDGTIRSIIDGKALTVKRTAATSALAARFLSNPDSKSLLMIGTGALSPNLIEAHCAVRPINKVYVWGRSLEKAKAIQKQLDFLQVEIVPVTDLDAIIPLVDIISCATLSSDPIIKGALLRPGQHIDLVGAYKKDMREADDDVIVRGSVFIDTFQGGLKESGDIVIPLESGILQEEEICADLIMLCKNEHLGRTNKDQITVFKSVGHASEDLIAANYYFNQLKV